LGEKDGNARERVAVMGKLPGESGEELVENGPGKGERTLLRDCPAEHLVASPARKRKSRYQSVRVECDILLMAAQKRWYSTNSRQELTLDRTDEDQRR